MLGPAGHAGAIKTEEAAEAIADQIKGIGYDKFKLSVKDDRLHAAYLQIASDLERKAQSHLRKGTGILRTAKLVGLGTGTVHRIKREMDA